MASRPFAVLLSLALAACGGGGARPTPAPGPGPGDPALSLEPQSEPLDPEQQSHLLRRVHWAIRPAERSELSRLGLTAYLESILDFRPEADVEAEAARHIVYPMNPTGRDLAMWWITLMAKTRNPLRETMAFLWHGHFAVSQVRFRQATTMHLLRDHVLALRRHCVGNVRTLLRELTADPAMQIWLDGVVSTKEQPNENLAREFFERFALGIDRGYTQQDIVETARAFTGYRIAEGAPDGVHRVVFDPARHDAASKTIFGRTGAFDLAGVVALTIAERDVAGHIARRLFEHFCYAPAPGAVVERLAAILRGHDYELRPTLVTLLRSRAFFSAASRRSLVKSPVEAAIGVLRATELAFPAGIADLLLATQEQRPTEPPDVGGWPADTAWLNPGGLVVRATLAHRIAFGERAYQSAYGGALLGLLPHGAATDAAGAVAALADRLSIALTPEEAATYAAYLDTRTTLVEGELRTEHDPFRAGDRLHVDERLRGLLFLLTQHPSHLLR